MSLPVGTRVRIKDCCPIPAYCGKEGTVKGYHLTGVEVKLDAFGVSPYFYVRELEEIVKTEFSVFEMVRVISSGSPFRGRTGEVLAIHYVGGFVSGYDVKMEPHGSIYFLADELEPAANPPSGVSAKRDEAPCRGCGKPNDIGASSCWWCGGGLS